MRRAATRPAAVAGYTVDDIAYDAETHTSRLPDGRNVPHVTHVLASVGVSTDFSAISGRSERLEESVRLARERGTAVHADCHAFDDDDLDVRDCDPRVQPYVMAWATCRENMRLRPVRHQRERRLFHPLHVYTGILDGVFALQDGRHVLADLKTGDPYDSAAEFQTAAYEAALETIGVKVDERWAVWLRPDLKVPYRIVNYSDTAKRPDSWLDFQKFLSHMATYNSQPPRRQRVA